MSTIYIQLCEPSIEHIFCKEGVMIFFSESGVKIDFVREYMFNIFLILFCAYN